jgi:Putative holin
MLVGAAVGVVAAVFSTLLIQSSFRPDMVIALVLGVPSVLGLLMVMIAGQRWVTALGAFLVAIAPGWFAVLVLIQVVHGA